MTISLPPSRRPSSGSHPAASATPRPHGRGTGSMPWRRDPRLLGISLTLAGAILSAPVLMPVAPATASQPATETATADPGAEARAAALKPIATAFAGVSEDVREFDEHLVFLASRFCEGRVPGSEGAELATKYVEHYFEELGLQPAFGPRAAAEADHTANGSASTASPGDAIPAGTSFRQYFPLSYSTEIKSEALTFRGNDGTVAAEFTPGVDFHATTYGSSGDVEGRVVFAGYSLPEGPDDYRSYPDDADLSGKIVLMLRFEPMNEEGKSLWAEGDARWTGRSSFQTKIKAASAHNAAAVIIANTPGADDPRNDELFTGGDGTAMSFQMPVFNMTIDATNKLLEQIDPEGRDLMDLRRLADASGGLVEFDGGGVHLKADLERVPFNAVNVGGMVPGRGDLADEVIIVGAHRDHIGMGNFGSRWGSGKLHPGADDNASGTAALILLARKVLASYANLGEDDPARTVVFIAFDAEESGLNGARYYVNNPIVPITQHALMINFDMIGRIENQRLSVSGVDTAQGMEEWLQPLFESSPLEIVQAKGRGFGGSDHLPFYQANLPILFAIIADFHSDYHTPEDVAWKINRVGAVDTVNLFHEIIVTAGTRPESFVFQSGGGEASGGNAQAQRPQRARIRMGVVLGTDNADSPGAVIETVSPGWSAAEAGLESGDIIIKWNDDAIESARDVRTRLREASPDDEVKLVVMRDGKEIEVTMTLKAR